MSEKNNWNGSENPQPLDNEEKNEEEISAEAYEHVKHALSLMESEYFDDAIKSMQVAKELYSSIGREEEISIIREKISDIYTMKEQVFSERATESKMEVESEPSAPGIEQEKEKKEPKIEYSRKDKEIILNEAYEFLERGEKLANTDYFDDALKNLKDAKQLFNKIGNDNEIDRVAAKIEEVIAEKEARIKDEEKRQKLEDQKKKKAQDQLKARVERAKQREMKKEEKKFKKIQEYEAKKFEENQFREEIDQLVDKAEKLAREYDLQIRKGNFEQECVYPEIIDIYTKVRKKLFEKGWDKEASIYSNQIKKYKEKLEKDRKLRKLEEEKRKKAKEFENYHKSNVKIKEKIKPKKIEKDIAQEESDKLFEEKIADMVGKAENIVGAYDRKIRKGDFQQECVYPQVIDIYTKVQKMLLERGWEKEAKIYTNQIRIYKEKLEKDKKLRKLEEEKKKKDKEYEEYFKQKKTKKFADEIKKPEDDKKSDQERANKAFDLIDKAEKAVKNYELKLKKNILLYNPPYTKAINLYEEAKAIFKEIGWKDEATRLHNTITFYKQKKEKDDKLREQERKKLREEEEKEGSSVEGAKKEEAEGEKTEKEKVKEIQEQKTEQERLHERILKMINEAETIAKKYEKKIKRNKTILLIECPYEQVIDMYREARKRFKNMGWEEEAQKLISSINFYKKKLEKDQKLREFKRKKKEKEKSFQENLRSMKKPDGITEELKREKLAEAKEESETEADEIFNQINEAEQKGKQYERKIKRGKILEYDSPYEEIIQIYRNARSQLEEIGWEEESQKIVNSITYYKEKREHDKKLRDFERKKEKNAKEFERMIKTKVKKADQKKKQRKHEEEKQRDKSELRREEAFNLMDNAKMEFKRNNFDEAINFYRQSKEIFEEIGWKKGETMVNQSISVIKRRKKILRQKQQKIEEKAKQKEVLEQKLEKRISRLRKKEKSDRKFKQAQLAEDQKEKEREMANSEKAYTLLEEGTQLAEKKKFDKALEKYEQARDIFQDLGWSNEVSRINNELLYNLKKERKQAEKLNKFKKKQIEKEKALETLLKQAEEKRKKKVKQEKKEKREKLKTLSGTERKKEKLLRKQKEAEELIEQDHLNESIRVLKKMQKMCKKADLEEEFPNLDQQISQLKATASIPIITDRAEEKDLKEESFQAAYTALDKANSALKNGHIMKAISELNEAKFNLQSMPSHAESVTLIEEKIEDCKHQLRAGKYVRKSREALAAKEEKAEEAEGAEPSSELAYEYMDKSNKEKRKNNYQKAISLAKKAMDIFEALGSEWAREKGMVTKHIVKLEQSYDKRKELFSAARKAKEKEAQTEKAQKEDLKSRVEERRTDRQKKIRKLMKEKKEKEND